MWISTLLEYLIFYSEGNEWKLRPESDVHTWSWAHFRGQVAWYDADLLPTAKLVNISFEAKGPANFGKVINTSIKLKGPMMAVSLASDHTRYPPNYMTPIGHSEGVSRNARSLRRSRARI